MDALQDILDAVRQASASRMPVTITGGGSRPCRPANAVSTGREVSMTDHTGIMEYHPEELVVRVRAGTRLTELIEQLTAEGQMLACDPPVHGDASTVGGLVASGLSGSRRPYAGAIRDAVLGTGVILQDGTYAEFGGQVMKNVAGYDVSRLVCGSWGILGPIADISLKVLPLPEAEESVMLALTAEEAKSLIAELIHRVSGLSASCYLGGRLALRFSGSESVVKEELDKIGGEPVDNDFWSRLDTQDLDAFEAGDIWRLSTHTTEVSDRDYAVCDWGFAQRWLIAPESDPRENYDGTGHWTRVRTADSAFDAETFHPLPAAQMQLMQRIKAAFDPHGIFNPGRMYPGL